MVTNYWTNIHVLLTVAILSKKKKKKTNSIAFHKNAIAMVFSLKHFKTIQILITTLTYVQFVSIILLILAIEKMENRFWSKICFFFYQPRTLTMLHEQAINAPSMFCEQYMNNALRMHCKN